MHRRRLQEIKINSPSPPPMDSFLFCCNFCCHFSPHSKPNVIYNHPILTTPADSLTSSRTDCWISLPYKTTQPQKKHKPKAAQTSSWVSKGLKENWSSTFILSQICNCITVLYCKDSPMVLSKTTCKEVIHLLPKHSPEWLEKNSQAHLPLLRPFSNAMATCQHHSRCTTGHYKSNFQLQETCLGRPACTCLHLTGLHQTCLPVPGFPTAKLFLA